MPQTGRGATVMGKTVWKTITGYGGQNSAQNREPSTALAAFGQLGFVTIRSIVIKCLNKHEPVGILSQPAV